MKKRLGILTIVIVMLLCGCSSSIPLGYVDKVEYFDEAGFQDYTDYGVYRYNSADAFIANQNYHKITTDEIDNVKSYFENFESWMAESDRIAQYDFDENCMNEGDYVRIDTKEGERIGTGEMKDVVRRMPYADILLDYLNAKGIRTGGRRQIVFYLSRRCGMVTTCFIRMRIGLSSQLNVLSWSDCPIFMC